MDRLLALGETTPNPISLTDFKRTIYRRYQHQPHLEALDQHLTQVSRYIETGGREGIWFLIVEMPPRHGKTLTVSRLYPAWHLGRNPNHRVMLVSYGDSLATKNSRAVRNMIASPVYAELYPHTRLAKDSRAVDAFDLDRAEGGIDALGVLGAATGKGAHLLIGDDLVKNRQEAESELLRDRTWDAFIDDLLSRLEPSGAVVLFATRWHMDDVIGRAVRDLIPQYPPGRIVRLRLPAIAEADDPIGRAEGEALWSERYPIERLREIERTMGAYSWSALYQQNPVPAEGGIFKRKWFEPQIDDMPPMAYAVRFWDLAMSDKTSADYTVGTLYGMGVDGHRYVLDVARKQIDWGDLTEWLANVMLGDGPNVAQGIEEKGYMSRAVQALNADARLRGYSIFGYPKDKDKLTNALPFAAKAGAGLVHVLNRHWTQNWIEEVCSFPNGANDDQVDSIAGADTMLDSGAFDGMGSMVMSNHGAISQSEY